MKISERQLNQIIVEEIREYLAENALCHDSKGHFDDCKKGNTYSLSKKGARSGGVDGKYVGRGTISSDEKKKDGTHRFTSKMGLNTSKAKSGGRKVFPQGDDRYPEYSVSKYPKKYTDIEEQEGQKYDPNWPSARKRKRDDRMMKPNRTNWVHGWDEMDRLKRGVGLGILQDHLFRTEDIVNILQTAFPEAEENGSELVDEAVAASTESCRRLGLITIGEAQKRILMSLNAFALAKDGKLNAPRDKQ